LLLNPYILITEIRLFLGLPFFHIRGLLQKSWRHYFPELSEDPTGIFKFAAERQQRLFSNDAAR
jgi:hypothetical protein